jgi:cathepsin C
MVYDEGFIVELNDFSFFSFSKYKIDNNNLDKKYVSQCFATCVGWYNTKDKSKWGCYKASKDGVDSNTDTFSDTQKMSMNVVEPENIDTTSILNKMLLNMSFKSVKDQVVIDANQPVNRNLRSSFLEEKEGMALKLDSSFNNHSLYLNKLKNVKKSWNAGLHSSFTNLTIKQLNKFAGIPRSSRFRFKSKEPKVIEDLSMFPKNFDWKNKLKPAGSQGNCGSCYVYSTMRMMEARLKIKHNHNVNLSIQHALDCSYYNQGCNGGYPILVMKYASEFELIPESCKAYQESDDKCLKNTCDMNNLPYIYKASNYHYVGGSYGKCSEKLMMEEVYSNGPIVVSFEPDYNFMMYKNGIYHSINEQTWINNALPRPEWEKVDHSVLLVGWGEEENTGEKYWIIQNTWGPAWGEEGFFRMKRGTDEFGIESICETATPLIIDNKTKTVVSNVKEINGAIDNSIFDYFK